MLALESTCSGVPPVLTVDVSRRREGMDPVAHNDGAGALLLLDDEAYYLDNPPAGIDCVKFKNANGEVVAYFDEEGNVRHKGRVFEGWDYWDYWD